MQRQTRVTNSPAAAHESWLVRTLLALQDLAEAIPIISQNGLPLLTKNNLHTLPSKPLFYLDPPVYWYLGYLSNPHFS